MRNYITNLKKKDHLGRPRHRWEDNIEMNLNRLGRC
jgi:hypothetical protein